MTKRIPRHAEQSFVIPKCALKIEGQISHSALNAQTESEEMYLDRCSEDVLLMYFINGTKIRVDGCEGCGYFRGKK